MKNRITSLLSFCLAGALFVCGTAFFSHFTNVKAEESTESSGQVTNAIYLGPAATLPSLVICESSVDLAFTGATPSPTQIQPTIPSTPSPTQIQPTIPSTPSPTQIQPTIPSTPSPTQIQPTIPILPETTHPATPFVLRFYEEILQRIPDSEGLNYWVNGFSDGSITASQAAFSFFVSQEMEELNLSDREYIQRLYTVLLGRNADAEGQAFWSELLNNGVSRTGILRQLIRSQEFLDLCQSAGIALGQMPTAKDAKDVNLQLTVFINRQYRELLGRNGDSEGLNFWADLILNGTSMEEVSKQFVFSKEFTNKNYSNVNFINILYRAFMGRESDAEGLSFWQTKINAGMSREDVFANFAYSKEFAQIVKAIGL